MHELPAPFSAGFPDPSDRCLIGRTPVWTFAPEAPADHAVMFLHHRTGFDAFTAHTTTRLLEQGFVVAIPELFAGQPSGLAPEERKALLHDDDLIALMAGTIASLASAGLSAAALGFCMGGRLALLAAVADIGVHRACGFYGGNLDKGWHTPISPLHRTHARVPLVQLHRGTADSNPSAAQLSAAVSAFDEVGGYLEACTYTGAGHAFANPFAPDVHHPTAAARAWSTAMAFLTTADDKPLPQPGTVRAGATR
ncbi:dienelactone hydrolase family protein [Streptomyces sp. NPDC050164]|uniref:dienelactone hydrolase family protein n=1 Tax=Streptomyces sp. NPDC050164 TaxID=3365605 RepID=UPI0037A3C2E2